MAKFMCTHTLPPNEMTEQQVNEVAKAGQNDSKVKGYRSFLNLSEGKILCVVEASTRNEVSDWFGRMKIPYDSITPVEYEGEFGTIYNLKGESHEKPKYRSAT